LEELPLAQAQSNRAPQGRQHDFRDAKRLGQRWLAGELMLSFVPEPEQRAWRRRTRGRLPLVRERVRLPNQVEALREEARSPTAWRGWSGRFSTTGSATSNRVRTPILAKKRRAQKLAQTLRNLGYSVALTEVNPGTVPAANA
jgi:hypothetical protein